MAANTLNSGNRVNGVDDPNTVSSSTLRREPTWSRSINFDDGFEEALASSYDARNQQRVGQVGSRGYLANTRPGSIGMPGSLPLTTEDHRISNRVVSGASDGTLPASHRAEPPLPSHQRQNSDLPRPAAHVSHQRQYSSPLASAPPLSSADIYAMPRTADAAHIQQPRINGYSARSEVMQGMRSTDAPSRSGYNDPVSSSSSGWDPRPASAMSFQTALSGGTGFMFSSSEESGTDRYEDDSARQAVQLWPEHSQVPLGQRLQPWLDNSHMGSGSGHMYGSGAHSIGSGAESRWTDAKEDFAPPLPPKGNNRYSIASFTSPSSRFEDLPDRNSFVSASSYVTPDASPDGYSVPLPSAVSPGVHRATTSRDYSQLAAPESSISTQAQSGGTLLQFDPHQPFEHRREFYTTAPLPVEDDDGDDEAVLDRHSTLKQHSRTGSNAQSGGSVPMMPSLPGNTADTTLTDRSTPGPPASRSPPPAPSAKGSRAASPMLSDRQVSQPSSADTPSKMSVIEDVIPPPLPETVVEEQRAHARAQSSSGTFVPVPVIAPSAGAPVSDFRQRPLANITPQTRAEGVQALNDLQHDEIAALPSQPSGWGAAPPGRSGITMPLLQSRRGSAQQLSFAQSEDPTVNSPAHPALAQHRRGSSGNVLPKAALAEPPLMNNSVPMARKSVSSDTPSREPSPPPEGEIEARAEWETRQLKLQERVEREREEQVREKKRTASVGNLKQVRPLQYIVDENFTNSPLDTTATGGGFSSKPDELAPDGKQSTNVSMPARLSADSQGDQASGMSTLQLQRQQRKSVGTLNLSSQGADLAAGGSSGPYPAFSSPTSAPTRVTGASRQYPGLMPQRSLVPPFELQQRPDGLLSGLIGPDGVRRSVNDPEVCLECMMRDEDMIDVNVVGKGLWERESDRDFEEALRAEEALERDTLGARNGRFSNSITHESLEQGSSGTHETPSFTSVGSRPVVNGKPIMRVKKIGKSDPLTAERLKLHTQMNIPASSHRWRTLQTFLAQQAKYIAMDQRARAVTDAERRAADIRLAAARERERAHLASAAEFDSRPRPSQRDATSGARGARLAPAAPPLLATAGTRPRSASVTTPRNVVLDDEQLSPEERAVKDRDVAAAREARRKLAQSDGVIPSQSTPSRLLTPAMPRGDPQTPLVDDPEARRFSSPMPPADSAGAHSVPRRSAAPPNVPSRVGSSQDLRTVPGSMSPRSGDGDNLAPPMRPYGAGNSRFGKQGSSATSQVSAIQSGSMVDMHVGLEDRTELRIAQSGFVPGPPLLTQSPGTVNRAFYGFASESDTKPFSPADSLGDRLPKSPPKSPLVSRFDDEPGVRNSREEDMDGMGKRKKKGLRGLLNKMTGSSNGNIGNGNMGHASIDSPTSNHERDPFGRPSQSSSNPPNDSLDLAPPPGLGGLLARGRRSASSLLDFNQSSFESDRARAPSPGLGSGLSSSVKSPGASASMSPIVPYKESKTFVHTPDSLQSRALPLLPEIQTHTDSQQLRSVQANRVSQQSLPGLPTPPSPSSRAASMLSFSSKPTGRAPPVPGIASGVANGTAADADRSSVASRSSGRRDNPFPPNFQSSPRNTQQFSMGPSQSGINGGNGIMAEARWPTGAYAAANSSLATAADASHTSPHPDVPPRSSVQGSQRPSSGALASAFASVTGGKSSSRSSRRQKKETQRATRSGSNTPSATSSGAGHSSASLGGLRQSSSSQPPQQGHGQTQGLRIDTPSGRAPSPGPSGRAPSPGPRSGHLSFGRDNSDFRPVTPGGKEKSSRASKIMKLTMNAFGKKKRDSSAVKADRHGPSDGRASSMANMILRKRKSETAFERVPGPMFTDDESEDESGLAPPNRNAVFGSTNGRARVVSSPHDPRSFSGRSQSAMGMLPSQRFVNSGRGGSGRSYED